MRRTTLADHVKFIKHVYFSWFIFKLVEIGTAFEIVNQGTHFGKKIAMAYQCGRIHHFFYLVMLLH